MQLSRQTACRHVKNRDHVFHGCFTNLKFFEDLKNFFIPIGKLTCLQLICSKLTYHWIRADGSHPPSVGSTVSIVQLFVVLSWGHHGYSGSIRESQALSKYYNDFIEQTKHKQLLQVLHLI